MKENESKEDHENRQLVYELTGIRDESLHIQPYADMIDKLTYVQKADFAKRALELERDCATYKKMFEEVSRERNAWIHECQLLRSENKKLQEENGLLAEEEIYVTSSSPEDVYAAFTDKVRASQDSQEADVEFCCIKLYRGPRA